MVLKGPNLITLQAIFLWKFIILRGNLDFILKKNKKEITEAEEFNIAELNNELNT